MITKDNAISLTKSYNKRYESEVIYMFWKFYDYYFHS